MTEPTLYHSMLSLYSSVPDLSSAQTHGERVLGTPHSPNDSEICHFFCWLECCLEAWVWQDASNSLLRALFLPP